MIYLHLIEKLSNKTLNFMGTLFKMNETNSKCNVFASPNVSSKFRPRNQKLNVKKNRLVSNKLKKKLTSLFLLPTSFALNLIH